MEQQRTSVSLGESSGGELLLQLDISHDHEFNVLIVKGKKSNKKKMLPYLSKVLVECGDEIGVRVPGATGSCTHVALELSPEPR